MFKKSAQKRRCAILADGFYEWQETIGHTKIPHYFFLKEHEPFAFARLYEPPAVEGGPSRCMVVTTTPNSMLEAFNDRMPVILQDDVRQEWMSDAALTEENLPRICRPFPAEGMQEYRTDSKMSNSRYKGTDATEPWRSPAGEFDFGAK